MYQRCNNSAIFGDLCKTHRGQLETDICKFKTCSQNVAWYRDVKILSKGCQKHSCKNCVIEVATSSSIYCAKCVCKRVGCTENSYGKTYCRSHLCKNCSKGEKRSSLESYCTDCSCKFSDCDKLRYDHTYCTGCENFYDSVGDFSWKKQKSDVPLGKLFSQLRFNQDFLDYAKSKLKQYFPISRLRTTRLRKFREDLEVVCIEWLRKNPETKEGKNYCSILDHRKQVKEKEEERLRALKQQERIRRHEKNKLEQEKQERISRRSGLLKAGIAEYVIDSFVDDVINKNQMYALFGCFGEDLEDYNYAISEIILKNKKIDFIQNSDFKKRIVELKTLTAMIDSELLDLCIKNKYSNTEFDFIKNCSENEDLYFIKEVLKQDSEYKVAFVMKLFNDYGFDKNLNALKEVFEGADWEATAVKYGFLQY